MGKAHAERFVFKRVASAARGVSIESINECPE